MVLASFASFRAIELVGWLRTHTRTRDVGGTFALTGTGNRSFGEKSVNKNQLRHKIRTTESDFESFMEDNGRGQWGR